MKLQYPSMNLRSSMRNLGNYACKMVYKNRNLYIVTFDRARNRKNEHACIIFHIRFIQVKVFIS